ncbi:hypothetical protein E0H82_08385 [Acinetobacter sp. ANC 4910]|uniref:DUF6585 family protein n=1 Tax=Acinetobacter sp. ANC 4910 TaxID=2529850 RepID=UPI001040DB32|nr:DUF6585 family protein [Acinetobacter sp. ANC 4910]TCB35262.1 hypothetical protein E0H82_08385 [Acinetobacter sp. ANC 4910]
MSRRIIAQYRQTFILRAMATAVLLFIAFLCSEQRAIVGLCFCLLMLVWIWGFKEKIILYPNQLQKQSLFGTQVVNLNAKTEYFYKFTQIRVQGVNAGQHTYITVKNGNQSIKANSNIKNIEDLYTKLIQIEVQNLEPQIQKALQERSSLSFGVMKVSATGLAYKNKMLTYAEITDFGIENGSFFVKKQGVNGNFFKIPIAAIPNMTTFFMILDHYIQEKLAA